MGAPLRAVLRVVCQDRPGLVAELSGFLFRIGANLLHADHHLDAEANTFFQRVEFAPPESLGAERAAFMKEIAEACERMGMRSTLTFSDERRRVALMCSKWDHCVLDLLARHRSGELACEIPLVISNHPDLELEVTRRGYRYVTEPVAGDKKAQEARVLKRLAEERIDLVVLARYMQILTEDFVNALPGKVINIHHSFLPAFIGADPYRQAFRRGVKLIGATSHYVTKDLDEGPIIHQDVARVSHRDTVEDMQRKGRDLERVVLAQALRCHLQDRIIAYGNKTVVFE